MTRAVVLLVPFLLFACGKRGDGGPGGAGRDSGPPGGRDGGGPPVTDCATEARWVYVVDEGNALLRFQPDELVFTPIGTLDCASGLATPFSMAVDRDARAWVLFQDGRIHWVSTTDASCSPSTFMPRQMGFELFGMGFASDSDGSSDETLFISGGSGLSVGSGSSTLGAIDTATLGVRSIGSLPGWPELSGTGAGELWGFFPDTMPRSVRQIDKTNGATPRTFSLEALGADSARAWAFAFWGGRFYIFLQTATQTSTTVWRLNPEDGSVVPVVPDTGYTIVGAGVSTCAPVELI